MLEHPDWCIHGFREAMNDCRLYDMHMIRYPHTWIRHRGKQNEVQEKLDRALVSDAWDDLFP